VIVEALGADGFELTLRVLRDKYDVNRDELPYRIDSVYQVLEDKFNVYGPKTLGTEIARKFYASLGLEFQVHDGYALSDYVEAAKSKLS